MVFYTLKSLGVMESILKKLFRDNYYFIFSLAYRNLWRRKRRTIINIVSVSISVMMLFLFITYYRGTYLSSMFDVVINHSTAHIQIHSIGFSDKEDISLVKEGNIIHNYQVVLSNLEGKREVAGVSERIVNFGFVSNGKERFPVKIVGIDPERNKKVFPVIEKSVVEGQYFGRSGAILGKSLAELFGFKVGDNIFLFSYTSEEAPNVIMLSIVGIYETGYYELDKMTVLIDIESARSLFLLDDGVNEIFLRVKDGEDIKKFGESLKNSNLSDVKVRRWDEVLDYVMNAVITDNIFYLIFFLIILTIAFTTISGNMYVSVFERIREIGTLRAIGWHQKEVFYLFISEAVLIGIIGSIVGIILGLIPSLYLQFNPLPFGVSSEELGSYIPELSSAKITCEIKWIDFIIVFIVGILGAVGGAFRPSKKASKMNIRESLGYSS